MERKRLGAVLFGLFLFVGLTGCTFSGDAQLETTGQVDMQLEETGQRQDRREKEEAVQESVGQTREIVVLYTNDVHCAIETDEESGILGYAKIAAMKKALEADGKDVFWVDAGDAIQGSAIGTLSDGEYIIQIMNESGYDLAIPGNHEFDYGMERFLELAKKADFPYIACNLIDRTTEEPVFAPYVIQEIGGKQVAFIGICTPKSITSSTPSHFQNEDGQYCYHFMQDEDGTSLYACVQEAVDEVQRAGADYVIAVAHLGILDSCSPWTSTELIQHTSGIDAVLDGHSHSVLSEEKVKNKEGKEVLLSSTGTKMASVGKLTIRPDGSMKTELIDTYDKTDDVVAAKINYIMWELSETLGEVIARSQVSLVVHDPSATSAETPVRIIRNAETNLGDLCADAFRYEAGADIALMNGGGIRTDLPAGDITYGDIINLMPFGNEFCMVEATGQQVLDALEMSVKSVPDEFGGFLQVSGISFEIHMKVDSPVILDENGMFAGIDGERRVGNVMVDGEPLDPEKIYTVASYNYLLKYAGDGNNIFVDCKLLLEDTKLDNQVLIDFIVEGLGGIVGEEYKDPYGQGRIVAVE